MSYISIIIPHFNSPKTLGELLNSIPDKDEYQVIVVDDRSTQRLEEYRMLKNQYKLRNIIFLDNDTLKKGAGVCRNIGLMKATGKWVLFADSDDYFTDDMHNSVTKYINSKSDVIFFTPTSIEVDNGEKSDRHILKEKLINDFIEKKDRISELLLRFKYVVPWSKMYSREFLRINNIYFDDVIASNDVMFSTKVGFYMKNFEVTRDVIYCVTRSRGTLTTNISEEIFDARLSVYINYCKFLRSNLSHKELEVFNLNGRLMIINAIKYRYRLNKIIDIYFTLRKHHLKVIQFSSLNPINIVNKVYFHYNHHKKQKKYLTK